MVSINWCKKQSKGIELISPSEHISFKYIVHANETLELMRFVHPKSEVWFSTMNYYFIYSIAYAYLMRVGVKCEIHECTIKVIELLEAYDFLPKGFSLMLIEGKKNRIDNQYHLKSIPVAFDYEKLYTMLQDIKLIISSLSEKDLRNIRKLI